MDEDAKNLNLQETATKRVRASLDSIGHEIDDCIMKLVEDGADLCDACDQACEEYADKYNKNWRKSLVNLLIDMRTLSADPGIKSLLKKARKFERKGYDYDDALRAAISRLKHVQQ